MTTNKFWKVGVNLWSIQMWSLQVKVNENNFCDSEEEKITADISMSAIKTKYVPVKGLINSMDWK